MIAYRHRGRRSLLAAAWWGSVLTAVFALVGLVVISGAPGAPRLAPRANTYNQMTGIGSTASAVTVGWKSGLLDSSNQPITDSSTPDDGGTELNPNADRAAGTGSLSFMDSDFANLSVTVSQTENITHQGITVSWTGAQPSVGGPLVDFMQMMECYGDSASGPSPEDCEYGSPGMLGTQIPNQQITGRIGPLCTSGSVPSATSPPSGPGGGPPQGCDPNEYTAETPAHCDPSATGSASCSGGQYSIPFVPADDAANPVYGAGASGEGTGALFNELDTNEVQAAYTGADPPGQTGADGSGQQQFETLTTTQAPGLGCGETESNGQTRSCWLVIVPRGSYEPNGFKASTSVPLYTSPLSAGNWAQRIQVHLGYAPLTPNCPPTIVPDQMAGTQVAYRAVASWQAALNQAANCTKVYSYTATPEGAATSDLDAAANSLGGPGLAFTTIPIGSEATRYGGTAVAQPNILYAPVAVTPIDFGFNVNTKATGQLTTPVNLTPSLLAKALTQVYKLDLPDFGDGLLGPDWVQQNPLSLLADPAFTGLNPELPTSIGGGPTFPFITGDHSGDNQRIWQWIQSDPATASWLDGGTDASNPVTADPAYVTLNLGQSPATDGFAEAYKGTLTCGEAVTDINQCGENGHPGYPDLSDPTSKSCDIPAGDTANTNTKACTGALSSENLLPVENNFDQAAASVLAASDPGNTKVWDPSAKAPDATSGWFDTVGVEQAGATFLWTVNDMPDLAAYGLLSAALCPPTVTAATAATACVQPSTDNVTAALNSATPDSAGLLQVNPATVPSGAYPLVDVVYAAVPTDQSAQALSDYANFISYAAGQGQATGTAPGDLPPGYLPLPANLQTQAQSVVTQLQALAGATASPTASASTTASSGNSQQSTTTGGGSTTTGGGSTTTGGGSTTTGGGSTTTGGGSTTTGGGSTTTGGGSTTTGGGSTTTGGGSKASGGGSTATGSQAPTTAATSSAATSTCTAAAPASPAAASSPAASASGTAAATTTSASTACASSSPTQAFDVLPGTAQAVAGTTQATSVTARNIIIIVLCVGGGGGILSGGLLFYGRMPRRGRSRERPGST